MDRRNKIINMTAVKIHKRNAFNYAFRGIVYAWKTQLNFKIETGVALATVLMSVFFQISAVQWLIVVLLIGLVLSLEILNTAVEMLCDLYSKSYHPLIKLIKDTAAGAVLIATITAVIAGLMIFIPHIF